MKWGILLAVSLLVALPATPLLGAVELVGGTWSFPDPNDGSYPAGFNISQDQVDEVSWLALNAFVDPALYNSGVRLVLLTTIEANNTSNGGFSVTYDGGAPSNSGTWSSGVPVNYVSVKAGNANSGGPKGPGGFALYEYDPAATSGTWNTNELSSLSGGNGDGRNLSHISFWGLDQAPPPEVIPEPASLLVWSALAACGAVVCIRRRRARQTAA